MKRGRKQPYPQQGAPGSSQPPFGPGPYPPDAYPPGPYPPGSYPPGPYPPGLYPAPEPVPRGPGGGVRAALVAIALLIYGTFAVVGVVGFIVAVGLFQSYSTDLPDAHLLQHIPFAQETIVYARDGKTELARFSESERREVASYDQLPPILIDATTAVEDKTFWTNTGFDPIGIVSAAIDSLRGNERGASTITQQLVRQRLLRA